MSMCVVFPGVVRLPEVLYINARCEWEYGAMAVSLFMKKDSMDI